MPCTLENMDWVDEKIESITCEDCIEGLYSYEFNDSTFVIEVPNDEACDDVPIVVFDCNGDVFCTEGGKSGSTACSDYFGEDFDPVLDTLWDRSVGCFDCDLDEQEWLQNKLDTLDCNSCIRRLSIIELDGVEYIYEAADFGINLECFNTPSTIYDCEGNIICQDIDDTQLDCMELLEQSTIGNFEDLWIKEVECEDCDLEDQVWLDSLLLSPSLCEDCISSIEIYTYENYQYVVAFGDDENCADALTTGYRCDGTILCLNGGFAGFTECDFLLAAAQQEEVLWEREVECIDNAVYNLNVAGLELFPNPTDQDVLLIFSADQNINLEYSVVNIAGQVVLSGKYNAFAGENQINFDLDEIASGMYFVRLLDIDAGGEQSLKLVKN